jgi:hypothetical protein
MGVRSNKSSSGTLRDDIINWVVVSILILVEYMSMSVRESSSFDILSRNSDIISIFDERSESQGFSGTPIYVFSFFDAALSSIKYFLNKSMEVAFLWEIGDLEADVSEAGCLNT